MAAEYGNVQDQTVEGPIKIDEDTTLYAIWADESLVEP